MGKIRIVKPKIVETQVGHLNNSYTCRRLNSAGVYTNTYMRR